MDADLPTGSRAYVRSGSKGVRYLIVRHPDPRIDLIRISSCMIDLAWKDHDNNPASVPETEIEDIDSKVFKIRPFGTYEVSESARIGGVPVRIPKEDRNLGINMRELNPQGVPRSASIHSGYHSLRIAARHR